MWKVRSLAMSRKCLNVYAGWRGKVRRWEGEKTDSWWLMVHG
jgi:hypothetical protein